MVTARRAALDLLQAVLDRGKALDQAMESHRGLTQLAPRDRAFAHLLAATTLRRLGSLDAVLATALDNPGGLRGGGIRHVLRLGAAQLLLLETPPHAAVDASVALAEEAGAGRFKGLVNAVLRRLAREGADQLAALDSARLDTPDWLWDGLVDSYGEAGARAIAGAHQTEAPLDLTPRRDAAQWAQTLDATLLPTGSLRRHAGGSVTELPGFRDGAFWVQDAAAALPVKLFGCLGPAKGRAALDLCAAPGGKTAQLAAMGFSVTAIDRVSSRLATLRDNLKRLRLRADTVTADAVSWRPHAPAPAVLLDAPCSATGTIRRHPDILWRSDGRDRDRLVALQDRLLAAAGQMVAPGGVLVYAVCSLDPEEGEARIAHFLSQTPGFARHPIDPAEIGGEAALLTTAGDLRSLPCHWAEKGGIDGFFAARLVRSA